MWFSCIKTFGRVIKTSQASPSVLVHIFVHTHQHAAPGACPGMVQPAKPAADSQGAGEAGAVQVTQLSSDKS